MSLLGALRSQTMSAAARLLGRMRRSVIGAHAAAVLAASENGLLLVPPDDMYVGRRLSFDGKYDPETVRLLLDICRPDSRVLFVGAHVGALVIPIARAVAHVTAVEPNPSVLQLLRMNIGLNSLENVEIHDFAAGDTNGEASFVVGRLNSGASGLEIGGRRRHSGGEEKITVKVKRLDDAFPAGRFELVVMDVEGAEPLALRGMGALLSHTRGLLIEVFERHLRKIARVSDEEFLSLVAPFFDEATILPEKPRRGRATSLGPYAKDAFSEMMRECCKLRTANIMFCRRS